jgi:hypothetical protein
MRRTLHADVILRPINFPNIIEAIYAEIDSDTRQRTGKTFLEDERHDLEWYKTHLLVSVYDWPRFERELENGNAAVVACGPVEFEDVTEGDQ